MFILILPHKCDIMNFILFFEGGRKMDISAFFSKFFNFGTPMFAFIVVCLLYYIGEFISTATKAWIPSVFVTSALFLVGYWYVFPKDIVDISALGKPLGPFSVMLIITHMGTVINLKQLKAQWKIIVITIAALTGMTFGCLLLTPFIGKVYVYAGLPPLAGGVVAAIVMQTTCTELGLTVAATLAIALYAIQGFFGYPLTAVLLKKEGLSLLDKYRKHEISAEDDVASSDTPAKKAFRIIPAVPEKYNTPALILCKLVVVALIATMIGSIFSQLPVLRRLANPAVIALILGVIFTEIGFLEPNSMVRARADGILMIMLMLFVFNGYSTTTPQTLMAAIGPMLLIIITGVIFMCICASIVGKFLGVNYRMSMATSLTALYGFPPNYILTEEAVKAITSDKAEHEFLMSKLLPQMLVGGFVTVTLTSVVLASIFSEMLKAMH